MFDLVVKRINSTYISAVDRRCYIKWREGKKWSRYTFSKRPGMSINYWTLEDAQNIQIARYIYFACSTVRFSSIDILKDCLNWLLGMDLGCHQLMFRWRGSIHRSPNNMDRYHLRVIAIFIAGWIGVAAVLLSSSLFLCRVNSVFYGSLRAKVLFSCMWLLSAIGAVVYPSHYTAAAPTPPYALCAISCTSCKYFHCCNMFMIPDSSPIHTVPCSFHMGSSSCSRYHLILSIRYHTSIRAWPL